MTLNQLKVINISLYIVSDMNARYTRISPISLPISDMKNPLPIWSRYPIFKTLIYIYIKKCLKDNKVVILWNFLLWKYIWVWKSLNQIPKLKTIHISWRCIGLKNLGKMGWKNKIWVFRKRWWDFLIWNWTRSWIVGNLWTY